MRLKFMSVEVEGSDETMRTAMQTVAQAMGAVPPAVAPAELPAAQSVRKIAPRAKVERKRLAAVPAEASPKGEMDNSAAARREAVLQMLRAVGPQKMSQILEYLGKRGIGNKSQDVTYTLGVLRKENLIYREDQDGTWRMAVKK